jgi:hypothetical protein
MPGSQQGPVPIMRMYGVTMEGNSICCHVHGFSPYFFVSAPSNFANSDCHPFKVRMFSCCGLGVGGWVGPGAGLDILKNRKCLRLSEL